MPRCLRRLWVGILFFAFISAVAFATILAVVAGLTISASTSFAHDFWTSVVHQGEERTPGEEVRVARVTAFVVGTVAMGAAILLGPTANVAFLVGLAFAVAASANLPAIRVLDLLAAIQYGGRGFRTCNRPDCVYWIDFGWTGCEGRNAFSLENPGILSIPRFSRGVGGDAAQRRPFVGGEVCRVTVDPIRASGPKSRRCIRLLALKVEGHYGGRPHR